MSEEDGDRDEFPSAHDAHQWAESLSSWRGYTAEMFDGEMRSQIRDCVLRIGSTMIDWRAAINGDAAAAIKLASDMRMPSEINSRLDVTMTVLLATAFDDPDAASLMASLLQRAPLDPVDRAGLSTSWLVHRIWRDSVIRNERKRRRSRGSESAS